MTRYLFFVLIALFSGLQYLVWIGKGGWLRVWDMQRQVTAQKKVVIDLQARNAAMAAEVAELKDAKSAVEERARFELNMIKPNELFVQVVETPVQGLTNTLTTTSTRTVR
jgi:cell division protein FtsB